MKVNINSKTHELPEKSSINQALKHINMSDFNGTAVAVNGEVVSKKQWNSTIIKNNDKILVIRASQGG